MIEFRVDGTPAPQGSKSPRGRRKNGSVILVESSSALKPWRERIAWAAREHSVPLLDGAISLTLQFVMPRPKSTPAATPYAVKRPDTDKLARGVLDALTGVAWSDDSQIVTMHLHKRLAYPGETPGLLLQINSLGDRCA